MDKVIEYTTKWQTNSVLNKIWLDNDKVICTYSIEYNEDNTCLMNVYVQEEYRKQGYTEIMLRDADKHLQIEDKPIYLNVRKDNFIIETYKRFGWEFESEYDKDNDWYIKTKTI
jgi:ribosomal protein S18 acetylase RimI-like enzyme